MNVKNRGNGHTWRMAANLIAVSWHARYRRFFLLSRRSAKIAIAAPGTPGDFRPSPRSAYKIARCVTGFTLRYVTTKTKKNFTEYRKVSSYPELLGLVNRTPFQSPWSNLGSIFIKGTGTGKKMISLKPWQKYWIVIIVSVSHLKSWTRSFNFSYTTSTSSLKEKNTTRNISGLVYDFFNNNHAFSNWLTIIIF